MPDGTQIAIDLMLPQPLSPETRIPALLIMARYWRSMELRVPDQPNKALIGPREPIADHFLTRGYAVVVMDVRGTGASMGVNRYPWSPEEVGDYGVVAEWIQKQSWCNGNIGAFGISYEGATALRLAGSGVAGVKAVIPQEIEFDVYTDVAMPGGVFNAAFIREWNDSNTRLDQGKMSSLFPFPARLLIKSVRPVDSDRKSRTMLAKALADHTANTNVFEAISKITYRDDPFGDTGATLDDFSVFHHREAIERAQVPIFSWGSWLDGATAESVLRTFNTFNNPQIAVIGAWKHEMTKHGSPFQAPASTPNPTQPNHWNALTQFFDQTLKEGNAPSGKLIYYYTLGAERWTCADHFPPRDALLQTWYFDSNQQLTPQTVPSEGVDTYTVDFSATTGNKNRWHTQMAKPLIYADRAREDQRLLTYTSAPLTADLEVTGYATVTLRVASSEPDTCFYVYLEEVDEAGVVRYLTEGQLRAIHRKLSDVPPPYWTGMPNHSYQRAEGQPMPINEEVTVTIGLQPVSALIRRGRRLRVALAGADADTFARIPTHATPTWRVLRGGVQPSQIQLPVVQTRT
jgi:putative CocE/NonD family hydrolase